MQFLFVVILIVISVLSSLSKNAKKAQEAQKKKENLSLGDPPPQAAARPGQRKAYPVESITVKQRRISDILAQIESTGTSPAGAKAASGGPGPRAFSGSLGPQVSPGSLGTANAVGSLRTAGTAEGDCTPTHSHGGSMAPTGVTPARNKPAPKHNIAPAATPAVAAATVYNPSYSPTDAPQSRIPMSFSPNPVVNGLIWSEILNRPGAAPRRR